MTTEFPANSDVAKRKQDLRPESPSASPVEKPSQEKKVEKVVTGKVIRRKKTLGTRIHQSFTGERAAQVRDYVLYDVLVPALKDMVSDATSGAVDRVLYKDERRRSSSRSDLFDRTSGRIAYHRMNAPTSRHQHKEEPARQHHRTRRSSAAATEVLVASRAEAQEALDVLYDLLNQYDVVSVSDLNNLLGLENQYTDDKWGWLALSGADIRRVRDGYLLMLPEPQPLD